MTAIEQLCKIITYARSTPQRKEKFMNYNSSKLELIPINIITTIEKEIKKYKLNEDDWNLLEEFKNLMEYFEDATTYISRSTYSTIGFIVPAYNTLLDILENFIVEKSTILTIKNTAQFATIFKKRKKVDPSDELATYLRESTADTNDDNNIDILE
ncbi:14001_t:CDS:2, partial [Racocetra persica]